MTRRLSWRAALAAVTAAGAFFLAPPAMAAPDLAATTAPAAPPTADRQAALVRMVRQDCGSCHGMQLTGGLGPALTPQALAGKPLDSLAATIFHGRPGTPMPPWRAMVNEADAAWIAERLLEGFPAEGASRR